MTPIMQNQAREVLSGLGLDSRQVELCRRWWPEMSRHQHATLQSASRLGGYVLLGRKGVRPVLRHQDQEPFLIRKNGDPQWIVPGTRYEELPPKE